MENEINSYLKHFGDELISKEIEEYAVEVALKHSRYIFTERRGKKQFGYCTYCKSEFETPGLKHKEDHVCPNCNSKVEVRASGISRKYMFDESYFIFFEKSKIDKDVVIAKGVWAEKHYEEDYKVTSIKYSVNALYVFKISGPVMLKKDWWYGAKGYSKTKTIYPVTFQSQKVEYFTCMESLEKAIIGTPYQYCMYKEYYQNENVVRYLDLYSKYPRIEDLTKIGFSNLVEEKLFRGATYNVINWRGKTVFKMLRLNRADLKELTKYEGFKSACFVRLVQMNSKERNKLTLEQLKALERLVASEFENFKEILKYTTLYKANKYILSQEKYYMSKFYRGLLGVVSDWRDYISDCKKLKMDITKETVLFPQILYNAHQNTIKQVKYQEDKLLDEKMKKREEGINKKYYFEDKDYIIRALKSTKEIIDEGKALHHCVGGYAEDHSDGYTNILVIREKKDLNKPFFTMEIENNRIVQVRGLRNCAPDKALNKFINIFKKAKIEKVKGKKVA